MLSVKVLLIFIYVTMMEVLALSTETRTHEKGGTRHTSAGVDNSPQHQINTIVASSASQTLDAPFLALPYTLHPSRLTTVQECSPPFF